jgi:hypothetical protein
MLQNTCTRCGHKITELVWKIGLILKILQINSYPLQRNPPPPYLYNAAYEFSIVQSSWHPVQQVRRFRFHLIDRLKMGSFQRNFRFGEPVKVTGG